MSSVVINHLLHQSTIKTIDYKPNIICFYHNGYWEQQLGEINANFYCYGLNKANFNINNNFHNFDPSDLTIKFDFILCTNKLETNRYDNAIGLSHQLHIPLIIYEHSFRPEHISKETAVLLKHRHTADLYVFPNDYVAQSWGYKEGEYLIQNYLLEKKYIKPQKNGVVIYTSHLANVPHSNDILNCLGQIPNSTIASNDYNEFIKQLETAQYFIDYVHHNEIAWEILEAKSLGCNVITNKTQAYGYYSINYIASVVDYKNFNKELNTPTYHPPANIDNYNNWNKILEIGLNKGYRR